MKHEGKYIYGVIATEEAPNFGPIGIGGMKDEVVTIGSSGLAAVISDSHMDHYPISHENMTAHMKVIEKVAESFTILPMRFCTIAGSPDEIRALFENREKEFKNMLKDMDGKVEVGIKIFWRDMKKIYKEITMENRPIRELKSKGVQAGQQALIRAGELVEAALEEKKAVEGDEYLRPLKKISYRCKESDTQSENMVSNSSFLIDKDWVKEFDLRIENISEEWNGRILMRYVGPTPPFNFVNIEMKWSGGRR